MNVRDIILTAFALLVCVSCKKEKEMTLSGLNIRDFQTEVDGQLTDLYVLRNENGMEACITNYGGRVVSLMVPDRDKGIEPIINDDKVRISDLVDYEYQRDLEIGRAHV